MSDSLDIDQVTGPAAATGPQPAAGPAAPAASTADAVADKVTGTLALTPPAPVTAIAAPAAQDAIKLDPATVEKLDGMVKGYVEAISSLEVHDARFEARVADIRKLGDDDIKASAQVSSRLLDRPVAAMQHGGISGSSVVSTSLIQLRRQIDDLDPAHQGDLLSPHKLLGILPFGDRLRDYFGKYQSSQSHLNAIITSLRHGQDTLSRDNVDLELEKANLWQIMERLRQYIYLGQKLDGALSARIAEIEVGDPDRAKVLKEDMLFYVRQKVQDLATQLAVSVQGYLALDVIRRNNLELIRGVDRATTTTVSALRTAVIVAQALANQKLVLDQITAINTTTSNLIESTSVLLRQQSGAINDQASSATIDLQKLQAAFDNIYATMDEIDTFKLTALENMSKTVDALTVQIGKAQTYLDRAGQRDASDSGESGLSALPK
jgi:uncharacterized protein YaaN involved in tellurite resistance